MEIVAKIVLTGGPCAGKTTALTKIEESLSEKGYKVFIVSESATELIKGGILPFGNLPVPMKIFQELNTKYQLDKEKTYEKAASLLNCNQKAVIVYDRGAMDNKAYVKEEEFNEVLDNLKLKEIELMDRYNMIIHLVTAAKGAEECYTLGNNSARTETKEEAIERDELTLNAWTGHPRLKIIDNSTTFSEKINNVLKEIYSYLGEPIPIKRERKYLISLDNSNLEFLKENNSQKIGIIQTYLQSNDNEKRLRKRTYKGENTYYLTTQKDTDQEAERIFLEKKINEDEYIQLLDKADPELMPISKDRHCFTYQNQYFRLDIIPELGNIGILEIEMTDKNKKIVIPNDISVIKEVTHDANYRNYNLAKKLKSKSSNANNKKNLILQ